MKFRVQGLAFRVQGLGLWAQEFGFSGESDISVLALAGWLFCGALYTGTKLKTLNPKAEAQN